MVGRSKRIAAVVLVGLAAASGGCGGGDDGDTAASTSSSSSATVATTTTASAPSTTTGPPTEVHTTTFGVSFGATIPGGWKLVERNPEVLQVFPDCRTCAHEGEELGELSFDLSDTTTPPGDLAARLAASPSIDASPVETWTAGDLTGVRFTATRIRAAAPSFPVSGYRSEAAGEPIDVYVVAASGKTMTIFVDPHEATGAAAERFRTTAAGILASIDVSP